MAAFGLIAAIVTIVKREVPDDPWILYRYADNLSRGFGWTFNPGVVSENAVTSPLTVLLLAGAVSLGMRVEVAAAVLFAVSTWAMASLSFLTFRHIGHRVAGMAAGAFLIFATPLLALRGMESSLYLALVAATMFAVSTGGRWCVGLLLGFAILARPDAVVLSVAIFAWLWIVRCRPPWREGMSLTLVVVPWLVTSLGLTGSVLPSTLAAKIAQERSGQWQGFLLQMFILPFTVGMGLWFVLALTLGLVGVVMAIRRRILTLIPLASAVLALIVVYGVVLRVAAYDWYYALPLFMLGWLAGLGAEHVYKCLRNWRATRWAAVTALGCVLVACAWSTPNMEPFRVEYEQVGCWLRLSTPPTSTVAAAEIGRLGYFSQRTMVDYLGLLNRSAVPHVERAEWGWWVQELHPDFWVTFRPTSADTSGFVVESSVRDSVDIARHYRPVMHTEHLVVYQRL